MRLTASWTLPYGRKRWTKFDLAAHDAVRTISYQHIRTIGNGGWRGTGELPLTIWKSCGGVVRKASFQDSIYCFQIINRFYILK